jgi:NAD(P)-dependent dehydrogenase (short-subunit alcohol dehydrogenase family)
MNNEKQNILITGCSSGIGWLTARSLAEKGHRVFATMRDVTGKNAEKKQQLEAKAAEQQLDIQVVELDVTDDTSVKNAVQSVISQAGRIDTVVNNAGIMYIGVSEAYSMEQARILMETNYFGILRMYKEVLPHMRKAGRGLIINVSSIVGRVIFPYFAIYSASKFALEALTEGYRYELAPLGIDTVIVQPGPFNTNLLPAVAQEAEADIKAAYGDTGMIPDGIKANFTNFFASEQAPNPQDVANAITHLIETPAGERPVRTVVGMDYGTLRVNESTVPVQTEIMQAFQLQEVLRLKVAPAAA